MRVRQLYTIVKMVHTATGLRFSFVSTPHWPPCPGVLRSFPAALKKFLIAGGLGSISVCLVVPGLNAQGCGAPLVAAQAAAFTLGLFTTVPAEKTARLLAVGSAARTAQLRLLLEPFNESELKLLKKAAKWPPYLVTRVQSGKLRPISAAGALLSSGAALAAGLLKEAPFTPLVENSLFGGHSCVSASYGPREGRVRYGDTLLLLDPSALGGELWASFSSGWHLLKNGRIEELNNDTRPEQDDVLAFSHTAFAGPDLPEIFRLMTIALLRGRSPEERLRLTAELLALPDAVSFCEFVDAERLGYMEAKIDSSAALSGVKAIEFPPGLLKDVLSWPEARPYAGLISAPKERN